MIGFEPSEEQQALQRTARDFADREVRPLAERAHAKGAPEHAWGWVEPVVAKGAELGFLSVLVPEEMGGLGGSCLDAVLLLEEIGAADVGVAGDYFALTSTMPLMMLRAGTAEQKTAFIDRFLATRAPVLAGAQSEPNVAGSELMTGGADPAAGPKLRARREGDDWVLDGRKSAFVTNASLASDYFILARTAPDRPAFEGLSIFHVSADTPGFSAGSKTELIGWPLTHHAELNFDGVRLPAAAMVGPENGAAMVFAQIPEMPICLAACFIGLAREAYEYALRYAKERQSGGASIFGHQAVALKLADMAVELQAARLLVWDAAAACQTDPQAAAMFKAPAAKSAAVDVAIANAQRCVEILGGYGVAREYQAGRFLNDAWVGYSCDFTRDVLRLGIAQGL
jgi:alkylation response protein AidB-like acyl-CoA dehydrogenase